MSGTSWGFDWSGKEIGRGERKREDVSEQNIFIRV